MHITQACKNQGIFLGWEIDHFHDRAHSLAIWKVSFKDHFENSPPRELIWACLDGNVAQLGKGLPCFVRRRDKNKEALEALWSNSADQTIIHPSVQ